MFGREMPQPGSMAGRTERAIAIEVLTLAGVDEPRRQVDAFHRLMAVRAPGLADLVRRSGAGASRGRRGHGRARPARRRGHGVVQSLLTGNIRPLAEMKLGPLGLTGHLDLDAGAYGGTHEVRAELVQLARRNASRAYRSDFGGEATVIVGDTPLDVEAALATGARAVGVATGGFTVGELAAAGAHAVLPDLADTDLVVAAILGTAADGTVAPRGLLTSRHRRPGRIVHILMAWPAPSTAGHRRCHGRRGQPAWAPWRPDYPRLLELQHGVFARWQAPAVGLSPAIIDARLRRGRWRPLYCGVYAAYTGPARARACCGPGCCAPGPEPCSAITRRPNWTG